jgi:hypothetical protein
LMMSAILAPFSLPAVADISMAAMPATAGYSGTAEGKHDAISPQHLARRLLASSASPTQAHPVTHCRLAGALHSIVALAVKINFYWQTVGVGGVDHWEGREDSHTGRSHLHVWGNGQAGEAPKRGGLK